jgi:hypothetical protein
MKTPLEVAREEAARAQANAQQARSAAERAGRMVDPGAPAPSGTVAMAVAAAHSASLAAASASEAAAHALAVAELEAPSVSSPSFERACLAVTASLRAAVDAAQAATAATGVASALLGADAPHPASPATEVLEEKRCAFCGRPEAATRLVAGPRAFICEECVKLCAGVLGFDVR